MDTRYIVRFIRSDDLPNEEYVYPCIEDATSHYNLFRHDDSCLYSAIQLIESGDTDRVLMTDTLLGLSLTEKAIIGAVGSAEQFDTCLRLIQASRLIVDETEREIATTARIKLANLSPNKFPIFFSLLKAEISK